MDLACVTSARTGAGLGELRTAILTALGMEQGGDLPRITNVRHVTLLGRVDEALTLVLDDLATDATEEIVLQGLTAARASVEEISGVRTPEDVLNHIFSRFCIGK